MMDDETRGARLRREILDAHQLDPAQLVILDEACRSADRLDELDRLIVSRGAAAALDEKILGEARQQQNVMKQLLVALRLPDVASGRRPQLRSARGAYQKDPGKVSSLERARAKRSG